MKTFLHSFLAALLLAANAVAASPKIGCAAEIGNPAGPSRSWALVFLKLIDDAEPHDAYRVYWKAGAATSANPYTLLATLRPMVTPASLTHILNAANQAGVDLPAFEARLDGILNGQDAGPSLAEKLSFLLQAQSDSDLLDFQVGVLANSHPVMAAALGRAYFASIPDNGPSTFEVRAYDPATQLEGPVVGRPTVQQTPELLPAPNCLAEHVEASQKGHLRVQLRWCYPLPLRHKFLHFGGTQIIRSSNADWQAAFGVNPPLNINRTNLLQAIADGHAAPVNGLPLFPEERPADALDPAYQLPLFTDDNDTAGANSLTEGVPFTAGDQYTYWIWEEDLFSRPGHPSQGISVTICDRIAPAPPIGLAALNERIFTGGAAHDLLALEWPTASPLEVRRWYLYCSVEVNDLLEAYSADPDPNVPGQLVAVIDNDGSHETPDGERIRFLHDGTAPVALPDPGETVYYRLRAEDDTPCKIGDLGNVSGPSGPVPASIHYQGGATPTGAWLEIPCCVQVVGYEAIPGDGSRPYTAFLRALRPTEGFQWVEFADEEGIIGRYEFSPGQTQLQVDHQPGDFSSPTFRARFGHRGGLVSAWREALAADNFPYDLHVFTPRWNCPALPPLPSFPPPETPYRDRCPGFLLPRDPETGEPSEVCIRFANVGGDLKSWIVYKQFGIDGQKTKLAEGRVEPDDQLVFEVCDRDFPPGGGEICYYVQGFTDGGNPGAVELAGCVKVAPANGLPVPTITTTQPTIEVDATASNHEHNIVWYSPPGAERFEIALCPAPSIAQKPLRLEINAAGQICEWGIVETPRTATGWGQSEFEFLSRLALVEGVNYRCKVRAVAGHGEERDHGEWSEVKTLHWLNQPAQLPQVPWPMRDAPGITGSAFMEWDTEDCILRVAIGELPLDIITSPLAADTMEPYLYHDLPFVAYLRETGPEASGRMLQVSRYFEEVLTVSPAPGTGPLTIMDDAVKVSIGDGTPLGHLWLRIEQGVLHGRTYEAFLVLHHPNGEIREVLRTNPVQVPTLLQFSP